MEGEVSQTHSAGHDPADSETTVVKRVAHEVHARRIDRHCTRTLHGALFWFNRLHHDGPMGL
jgi:hypothetical protein